MYNPYDNNNQSNTDNTNYKPQNNSGAQIPQEGTNYNPQNTGAAQNPHDSAKYIPHNNGVQTPQETKTTPHSYYNQPPYNQDPYKQSQPINQTPVYPQTPYQAPTQPHNAAPLVKPKAPPKKVSTTFKIAIASTSAAVLSVIVSVAIFITMIQTGFITVNDAQEASFTIAKVVDDENPAQTTDVSVLSNEQIAEKVLPSVVVIQTYVVNQQGSFWGASTADSEVSPYSEGSGIIMSKEGYIVTNAHVIEDATDVKVTLYDGTSLEAEVVGSDEITDLAVLKVEQNEALVPAEFGSSDDLVVGESVMAVGNPGGSSFSSSVTVGYVSALNRQITAGDSGYIMNVIQTDAAINPGNSGGALVNEYGQVIGINSSKFVAEGYEGLGFAIPIDDAQPIISDLQNYGYVKDRAVIGISGTFIDSMTARFYGLTQGMYVAEVTSPQAISSGLEKGDVITAIDGVEVATSGTVSSILATMSPGDTVELVVDRALSGQQGIVIELVLSEYVIPTPSGSVPE